LHGTADQLTAPAGSRALVEAAPSTDKTLHIYEGFAHDLVHEPKGAQVEDDILAWLAAHTGGPAVTPPPIYAGHLKGDPAGAIVGLQLGGGVVGPSDDLTSSGVFEAALHLTRRTPLPVGWAGALTVTANSDGVAAAVMPIGLSARFGGGGIAVASGFSTIPDGFHAAIPVGAFVELPVGPLHATMSAQLDYRITGSPPRAGTLSADLAQLGLALRLPGDKRYWPRAHAGVGPYVRGSLIDVGTTIYMVTAGLQLYGAD
jgi:fermentation-respiration switch protein FrsA (DUF1100 family)